METTKNAWINILFFVVTLFVNALGALGFINGLSQKDVSDMFETLITPSPATFSIWGVIYALLLLTLIVMLVKRDHPYDKKTINQITALFRLSCLLNMAWIIVFSYVLLEVSVLFIFGLVLTLSLLCLELLKRSDGKHWLLPLSFGLYTGWLFIATVVNLAAMLVKRNWTGFGLPDELWAIIMLIVAILLAAVVLSKLRNAAFPLPIAWAYFGIYQALSELGGLKGELTLLKNIALAGMIILVVFAAIQFYRNRWAVLPRAKNANRK